MGYADLSMVHHDIGHVDGTQAVRLVELDADIARMIDLRCGRSWQGAAADSVRTVPGPHSPGHSVLPLPTPIRRIDGIEIDGDAVDSGDYMLWQCTREGDCHAIRKLNGGTWPSRRTDAVIEIDGQWSDESGGGGPPAEIVAAATYLVAEEWKLRQASAAGEVGPDGMVSRTRNPWNFEIVKTAIAHHKAALPVASF